jgi:Response regulator containing a CheY-like receiver domain and a GGDEF domain
MNPEIEFNPQRVLIVDDNVKNIQVLGGFLQSEKLIVEFALDGITAFKWLDKMKFDLILLDIMMPNMDGYEVCSQIKKNPITNKIPIIFITAKTDSDSIIKGFKSGAVDYITKPYIKSELLIRVKTQLSIKKANEQLIHYLRQIEERNKNISESIEYAKHIQNAVLSTSEKNLKFLPEHFIIYLPKDILSGDFYWICIFENKSFIAVMDCTGHGVPGALMSMLGVTLLNETVLHDHIIQPDKILESLRSKIIQTLGQKKGFGNIKDGIEGSVICLNPESKKLLYSGAFSPMIHIHSDKIFDVKPDRIPIGYYEINENFKLHEIDIENNDTVYLFSDGIIDQFGGPENRRFMLKHLKEILLINQNKPMILQKEILTKELNWWKGDLVQTDDILVMGIRF